MSLPASASSWSTGAEIEHDMLKEKSRLIAMASHEPSQFNSIEWKVQNFYQSCMSLSFVESDREKPLTVRITVHKCIPRGEQAQATISLDVHVVQCVFKVEVKIHFQS